MSRKLQQFNKCQAHIVHGLSIVETIFLHLAIVCLELVETLRRRINTEVLLTSIAVMITAAELARADSLDRREKMVASEAENSWKDMFTKALASMKKLEKEITHKEREIQSLRSLVKGLEANKVSLKQTNLHLLAESEEYLCQCHRYSYIRSRKLKLTHIYITLLFRMSVDCGHVVHCHIYLLSRSKCNFYS